jgi:ankyrin repeat protein
MRNILFSLLLAASVPALADTYQDLLIASQNDKTSQVISYLRQGADPDTIDASGTTLLMRAAANGNMELSKALLSLRADVNKHNQFGETAAALAAFGGHGDIVRLLVEHGASINESGWGPLHYAVFNGHVDIARYLIDHGADVNLAAPNRYTPLMLAARNGHKEIVQLLLSAGAETKGLNADGYDAEAIAEHAGNNSIAGILRTLRTATH